MVGHCDLSGPGHGLHGQGPPPPPRRVPSHETCRRDDNHMTHRPHCLHRIQALALRSVGRDAEATRPLLYEKLKVGHVSEVAEGRKTDCVEDVHIVTPAWFCGVRLLQRGGWGWTRTLP